MTLAEYAAHFREHGWVLVDSLIPAEDIAAAQTKLFELYPTPEEVASGVRTPRTARYLEADSNSGTWGAGDRRFVPGQFVGLKEAPFGDRALDTLPLHDRILDLVEALLGTADIRLYQAETFAKYTGVAPYAQPLHIDETNHALVPPRRDGTDRQVQLFVYLSDVTEERGPTRVVSRTITGDITNDRFYFHNAGQFRFDDDEVAAAGSAGSVLAYSANTVHRGTDMVEPGAGRFFFNLGYRQGGIDWTGDLPWPRRCIEPVVHEWLQQLSARQLCAIGFPPPGHPYWDEETLAATALRYPELDLSAFR
jgi:ectoine hydroxylase-related dioxygenase (phytanoyl-CoA dioxygenase family)